MEKLSGHRCVPAPADVRKPAQLKEAVEKTIAAFGRIDFVICGASGSWSLGPLEMCSPNSLNLRLGAAGNFLAPISGVSENAFRTVVEIDTVRESL